MYDEMVDRMEDLPAILDELNRRAMPRTVKNLFSIVRRNYPSHSANYSLDGTLQ